MTFGGEGNPRGTTNVDRRRPMIRPAGLLALIATGLLAAACVVAPPPTPFGSLNPGEIWVPVANWRLPDGQQLLCAGGGFVGDYRLHGSSDSPRIVWMIGPDGDRTELAWPVGYRARFDPGLELLTADGRIVGREGTLATGGCASAERGVMSVELAKP